LYSFGRNDTGQLGFSLDYTQYRIVNHNKVFLQPKKIESINNLIIKEVICGSNFTFILDENKIAYSWGDNSNGQLARDTKGSIYNPHPQKAEFLSYTSEINKICCGWSHGIMLNNNGEVYVWGNYFKDYQKIFDYANDIIIPKSIKIKFPNPFSEKDNDPINPNGNEENNKYHIIDISSGFNHLSLIAKQNNSNQKELFTWGANEFVWLIFVCIIL